MGLTPGTVFEGRYRIERRLGQGGFADVYLGTHLEIDQRVAIKLLQKESAEPRFVREGKVLANLRSPYTLRILDFGRTEAGQAFLISEFVDGAPLGEVMANGPLGWPVVATMMDQVLSSLAEAHTAGVVHRDIKPDNIMQQPDGSVKVLDFGIARVQALGTLAGSGTIIGTPRYMAPEALLNPDFAQTSVDVYAVGLVAFGLLAGKPANDADTMKGQIARQLDGVPYVLPGGIDLPDRARRWVERMCAKEPGQRPADAGAALLELRELARRSVDTTQPPIAPVAAEPAAPKDSNPVLTALAAAMLLLFSAAFLWTMRAELRGSSSARPVGAPVSKPMPATPVRLAEPAVAEVLAEEPEPIDVAPAFERGRVALDEERWMDAAAAFAEVRAVPESGEAAVAERKGYVRRAIEEVLDMPATEQARTDVTRLTELFPEDERVKARLDAIEQELATVEPTVAKVSKKKPAPAAPVKKGGIEIVRDVAAAPEVATKTPPKPSKTTGRTEKALSDEIRPQMPEFRPCYATVSSDTRVTVVFKVLASGKTYGAKLSDGGQAGTKMWDCMVEAAHRLQFSAVEPGSPVSTVHVPLTLRAD